MPAAIIKPSHHSQQTPRVHTFERSSVIDRKLSTEQNRRGKLFYSEQGISQSNELDSDKRWPSVTDYRASLVATTGTQEQSIPWNDANRETLVTTVAGPERRDDG